MTTEYDARAVFSAAYGHEFARAYGELFAITLKRPDGEQLSKIAHESATVARAAVQGLAELEKLAPGAEP